MEMRVAARYQPSTVLNARRVGWTIPPLDPVGGLQGACSVMSLRRIGPYPTPIVVMLRRSTDNVQQGFGFTPAGDLDTASISAFLGGATGFVTQWYDQAYGQGQMGLLTPFGNFGTYIASPANQPSLNLTAMNGKPSIDFSPNQSTTGNLYMSETNVNRTNRGLLSSPHGGATNAVIRRWEDTSTTANCYLCASFPQIIYQGLASPRQWRFIRGGTVTNGDWRFAVPGNVPGNITHTITGSYNDQTFATVDPTMWWNATRMALQTTIGRPGPALLADIGGALISNSSPNSFDGTVSEFIQWRQTVSDSQVSYLYANQRAYWGLP